MKLLVLTDHSRHHSSNSFYAITSALLLRPEITTVAVASRGTPGNGDFFNGRDMHKLYGVYLNHTISFDDFPRLISASNPIAPELFDIILLRLPRPLSSEFFPALLEALPGILIVNDPKGIDLTSNKAFLATLDKFVPPCRVCVDWGDVEEFSTDMPVVLKPLKEYGGKGLLRIDGNRGWIGQHEHKTETVRDYFKAVGEPMLAMKFMKNVGQGDKRIVVANGSILSTSVRYPAAGSWLCNVSQGGYAEHVEIDRRDRELIDYINPLMLKNGIVLYGVDTLVDDDGLRVISEINTLSVGGIAPAEEDTGKPVSSQFAEIFIQYCLERITNYNR